MNFEGETGGAKVIHDDLLTRPRARRRPRPRMAELRLTHSRAPGAGQDGLNRFPACDVSQPRRTDAVPGCAYARQTGLRGFAVLERIQTGKEMLVRIVGMLTKLVERF